jgi:AhpD family alkylhydroperoxidase
MRLDILDRGHRPHTKAIMALIRVFSGHPVVDAVKLAFYRPNFYGGGPLTHEAMRGQSDWSVGDRELMAAYVSKINECPFCVSAHSATSTMWYADEAKVVATLADLKAAPIDEPLRATLRMLGKLTQDNDITADDIRTVLDSSVSVEQIKDAVAVSLAFNITDRLANAFGFTIPSRDAMNAGARFLLKRGYR